MKRKLSTYIIYAATLLIGPVLASCIHEYPDEKAPHDVRVHVSHLMTWTHSDFTVQRSRASEPAGAPAAAPAIPAAVRYHFQLFTPGFLDAPVAEYQFTRSDLDRSDFTTTVSVPPGDYLLYAWSDIANASTAQSRFFNSTDFSKIHYTEPYDGNNEMRDAFRGVASFTVDESEDADYVVDAPLQLERPLARYEFISTDLLDFLEGEADRGMIDYTPTPSKSPAEIISRIPEFNKYRVRMIYTGYMPSTFNNFINKPIDSRTGMAYDAKIKILNESEASIGFDHVMVNGIESSVAVAVEIYDPDNLLIARVNTINVPTKRNRNTTVRGRFLTSKATGGAVINPGFNGEFNIEIK